MWKLPLGNLKNAKFALHLLVGARRRSYIHRGRTPTASSYNEISGSMDGTSHERMDTGVLRFHRQVPEYEDLERQFKWKVLPPPETSECAVGMLGLGEQRDAARKISALGFKVAGGAELKKLRVGVLLW